MTFIAFVFGLLCSLYVKADTGLACPEKIANVAKAHPVKLHEINVLTEHGARQYLVEQKSTKTKNNTLEIFDTAKDTTHVFSFEHEVLSFDLSPQIIDGKAAGATRLAVLLKTNGGTNKNKSRVLIFEDLNKGDNGAQKSFNSDIVGVEFIKLPVSEVAQTMPFVLVGRSDGVIQIIDTKAGLDGRGDPLQRGHLADMRTHALIFGRYTFSTKFKVVNKNGIPTNRIEVVGGQRTVFRIDLEE